MSEDRVSFPLLAKMTEFVGDACEELGDLLSERSDLLDEIAALTGANDQQRLEILRLEGELDEYKRTLSKVYAESQPAEYKPRKLTHEQVEAIRNYHRWGYSHKWIARRFSVDASTISRIVNR